MPMTEKDVKHLKTMMGLAKSKEINIGVCLGTKFGGMVIKMDKIRSPENLGRDAKAEGETTKICVGILTVEGTTAKFKCADKPPTDTVKQLKAYCKSIKLSMSFKMTDINGNPIVGLEEEGAEGEGEGAENGPDDGGNEVGVTEDQSEEQDAQEEEADDPLRVQWQQAWRLAEPKVAKALEKDSPEAGKIRAVRDFAIGRADTGQFEAALKSLATLIGLVEAKAKTAPGSSGGQETKPQTADRGDLLQRLGKARPKLSLASGPLEQKLNEMFQTVVERMKTGALDAAAELLGKLEAALGKVEATKPEVAEEQNPPPDPKLAKMITAAGQARKLVENQASGGAETALLAVMDRVDEALQKGEAETALSGLKRVQDGLKLLAEVNRLAPMVAKAASSGEVQDVNALNLLFNSVADQIPAADMGKAMQMLARVEKMIEEGKTLEKTAFEQDQPLEIRPYAEARINWNLTRGKLRTEIGRLKDSIAQVLANEGIDDQVDLDTPLFAHIEKLDARLEAKLGEIVNSDPGAERVKLKSEARALIDEYNQELNNDFFKDVDDNNGFVQLAVTSTARDVLNTLSNVLAA